MGLDKTLTTNTIKELELNQIESKEDALVSNLQSDTRDANLESQIEDVEEPRDEQVMEHSNQTQEGRGEENLATTNPSGNPTTQVHQAEETLEGMTVNSENIGSLSGTRK
ncbi:hypothetical protein A2U01_0009709 [Trifolium medium]|uniref:Uncharacterized protein n=1 Tax=Trifolium medium TaxID=97028 RepID=A0A392MMT1_9FABA|nr:hypothetical protein [Trifolium medium]